MDKGFLLGEVEPVTDVSECDPEPEDAGPVTSDGAELEEGSLSALTELRTVIATQGCWSSLGWSWIISHLSSSGR